MRSIILLCLISSSMFAYSSVGEIDKNISSCQVIENNSQRLNCYDSLFEKKTETPKQRGKWKSQISKSAIDDSNKVTIALSANGPIKRKYGKSTIPTLVIRCAENKTELYIDWGFTISSQPKKLITRVDSEKAVTKTWNSSTDYNANFHQSGTIQFIKSMIGKDKFFVQVTPNAEQPVNTTFTLTGLDEAIKPLRQACKW